MTDEQELEKMREKPDEASAEAGEGPDYTKEIAIVPFDEQDERGKRFTGVFQFRVPNRKMRREMGLLMARLSGGIPWESLPTGTQNSLEMDATFAVCIMKRPDWFTDPARLLGNQIVQGVYGHLLDHWEAFFRPGPDQEGSEGASEDGSGASPSVES